MEGIEHLRGQTIMSIEGAEPRSERIVFTLTDGRRFLMWHDQDCCEGVDVEDVAGDVADLLGSPILLAEESTSEVGPKDDYDESFTWTFYKLATVKGDVTIRWYGQSNGYYSEGVDFGEVRDR
jgi:hypothetical protein